MQNHDDLFDQDPVNPINPDLSSCIDFGERPKEEAASPFFTLS